MDIDLRTSGGRGEYELAGEAAGTSSSALLGWTIRLNYGALGWRDTELLVTDQGGKPRLRIAGDVYHVQRQLASALMLPQSKREKSNLATGQPVIVESRYVLETIPLESVTLNGSDTTISADVGGVLVSNADHYTTVDLDTRAARVAAIHASAGGFPPATAAAISGHAAALAGTAHVSKDVERAVKLLMGEMTLDRDIAYVPKTDPLPALEAFIGGSLPTVDPPAVASPDEPEVRRGITKVWRLRTQRGPGMAKFRRNLMKAYDFTCAFCGAHLPTVKGEVKSGGQAAHILPYAEFDLDEVVNGMCLCPTHHWAFDEFLLVVDVSAAGYEVKVSELAKRLLPDATIVFLSEACGFIPPERLPAKSSDHPRPEYFERLYLDNPTD